mgnify:CR=1 FL=1
MPRSTNSSGTGFASRGEHRRPDGHRRHRRLPPRDRAPRRAPGSPSPCSAARQRAAHRAEYQRRAGPTGTTPAAACAAGREQVRAEPPGERRRAHVPASRHEQPARLQPSRAELPEPPLPRCARQPLHDDARVAHAGAPPPAAARRPATKPPRYATAVDAHNSCHVPRNRDGCEARGLRCVSRSARAPQIVIPSAPVRRRRNT